MIIDNKGKLFGKINVIDFLLILLVVLAVAFFAVKFVGGGAGAPASAETVRVEYYAEEVSDFVVDCIRVGDPLTDDAGKSNLGTVVEVITGPSQSYGTNEKGEWVRSTREDFASVRIVSEVKGRLTPYGVEIDGTPYGVGHSMTLRAGKAKIWLRVSGVDQIQ